MNPSGGIRRALGSVLLCSGALLIGAQAVVAEGPPLSLNGLLKEAMLASPEAAKIDATLADRAAEAFDIQVKQNPTMDVEVELPVNARRSRGREDTGLRVVVSQTLRASDFGDRAALARLVEEAGSLERTLALNEFIQTAGVLYARAWQFQERELLFRTARLRAQKILKKISNASTNGLFAEGDVELVKAEIKAFEAESLAANVDLKRAQIELTRMSGVAVSPRTLGKLDEELSISQEALEQQIRTTELPIQRRYASLQALAQKQLEVARLDSRGTLTPQLGYAHHDDGTDQVVLGFSMPLQIFNRNQGEQGRASGALTAAEKGQAYATSEVILSEAQLLYGALKGAKEQIALYEQGVLPAKQRALEAYTRQFDAGLGSAFQIWQALRELNTSQLRVLELQALFAVTQAQLQTLAGRPKL
jgi:cobalt-zinc-cadmium efflux system outer membrane protein